jgi:hypothetical protein
MTPEKSGTLQLHPCTSIGGFMINLTNRILREETDADKVEFVRGVSNLDKNGGKKVVGGLVAGYIIAKWLTKNG